MAHRLSTMTAERRLKYLDEEVCKVSSLEGQNIRNKYFPSPGTIFFGKVAMAVGGPILLVLSMCC